MKLKNKIAFASTITSIVVCSFQQVDLGKFENVDTDETPVSYYALASPKLDFFNHVNDECNTFNYDYLLNHKNVTEKNSHNKIKSDAEQLFGELRQLTQEELIEQRDTVEKISENTGVNFFDLC